MNSAQTKPLRIVIYSTRNCAHCRRAKDFLRKHKINFLEQDVERNQRAFKEFQRLGGRGVPVILIGKQRLDGFDPKRLEQALRKAGLKI